MNTITITARVSSVSTRTTDESIVITECRVIAEGIPLNAIAYGQTAITLSEAEAGTPLILVGQIEFPNIVVRKAYPITDSCAVNHTSLVGYTGNSPEDRVTRDGERIVSVNLAVRIPKARTLWFGVNFRERAADIVAQYVQKGSLIGVEGTFVVNHWTDRSGNAKSRPVVEAQSVSLLGRSRSLESVAA